MATSTPSSQIKTLRSSPRVPLAESVTNTREGVYRRAITKQSQEFRLQCLVPQCLCSCNGCVSTGSTYTSATCTSSLLSSHPRLVAVRVRSTHDCGVHCVTGRQRATVSDIPKAARAIHLPSKAAGPIFVETKYSA